MRFYKPQVKTVSTRKTLRNIFVSDSRTNELALGTTIPYFILALGEKSLTKAEGEKPRARRNISEFSPEKNLTRMKFFEPRARNGRNRK